MEHVNEELINARNLLASTFFCSHWQNILTTTSRMGRKGRVNAINNLDEKSVKIEKNLFKQLKHVFISILNRNKRLSKNWKALFNACIDQALATVDYKLLQLHQ